MGAGDTDGFESFSMLEKGRQGLGVLFTECRQFWPTWAVRTWSWTLGGSDPQGIKRKVQVQYLET